MIEWLGIGHLFELSRTEAIAGFFPPLVIFTVFFLAQLILPGKRVPGYVINPETGEPRNYRLNGILVFAIALIVWALELTGMPRDWFYRSSIYAVAGGDGGLGSSNERNRLGCRSVIRNGPAEFYLVYIKTA